MRRFTWLTAGIFTGIIAAAQNPATVFVNPGKTITLPCGTNCTNISVQAPNIRQTGNYIVSRPTYLPFEYTTAVGATDAAIEIDDKFSYHIPFPFAFSWCFFGVNYPEFVVGTNGVVTFDVTNSGMGNAWPLETSAGGSPIPIPYSGGTQGQQGPAYYPKASIMGPYHDIDPKIAAPNKKIEWRVEGIAPRRRFVISYNNIPLYNCNNATATHQMVLYENTGIIEIYVKDKPVCAAWNSGLAILGLQNEARDKAVAVPGKNATQWGTAGMDSAYRFTPFDGPSRFKRALLLVNNVVIATNTTDTATSTTSPEVLNVNFNNLCPTADNTTYVVRVVYGSCNNPNIETTFEDIVYVKKSTFNATAVKTDATCDNNGTITVTPTGGVTPYEYSINNGTTWQSGNTFNNLTPGNYTVITRQTTAISDCPKSIPLTIALNGSITVNAGLDTTICSGASFTRNVVSTGTSFVWTSSGGLNAPAPSPSFQLAPTTTTDYVVTAIRGNCTATDDLKVIVNPGATSNAGQPASIFLGQSYTMTATASPGTYQWTPSAGLSSATALQPVATPQITTNYTLEVTSQQGCKATSSVLITVVPYCIKVMEAFTPNGDGINDFWLITQGSCLKSAKAQVFNRNGAKVYESNDYRNNWNGTYNGKPLPDGTYYYIISYTLLNDQTEFKRGNLTILR